LVWLVTMTEPLHSTAGQPPTGLATMDPEARAMAKAAWVDAVVAEAEFWVFGYGSLMWKPGFAFAECRPARVEGLRRGFCVWSHRYRGTPERPGLVLGLDRIGGSCTGRAFRVADAERVAVIEYLWEREMVTGIYTPERLPARTASGEIAAHGFVVNSDHRQYAGHLTAAQRAQLIAVATGAMGPNRDYLFNTLTHLEEIGVTDHDLTELARLVRELDAA